MTDNAGDQQAAATQLDMAQKVATARAVGAPDIYCNGAVVGLGISDVTMILERNGSPVAVLNMSYTMAKTIARITSQTVAQLEELSKRDILTTPEIEQLFTAASAADEKREL